MKKLLILGQVLAIIFLFNSCNISEGVGGTATIKGKVFAGYWSNSKQEITDEGYAPEEDVYIVYGDDDIYGDDMKTHHDGSFEFKYLRKGDYTIFVYSDDTTGDIPAGKFPIEVEVSITEKNQEIDLGDIYIIK